MTKNFLLIGILVLGVFKLAKSYSNCDLSSFGYDPTLLQTNVGKVQGACYQVPIDDPDRPNRTENIMTWMAVPYAEPPINELRFRKPVPVKPWTDIRDGLKGPNKCMQNTQGGFGASSVSEDCLYLNIFSPAKLFVRPKLTNSNNFLGFGHNLPNKRKLAPVLVYIHGGAFILGSGDEDDPSIICGLSDIIVVTINYRLGPFGFMYLSGSNITGNQGFLDQSLAIKWVHENALSFGGDPNRITILGGSAGSFSVSFHLIYPPSWPYFKNAIMQSGTIAYSTMNPFTPEEASRRTRAILASLGCNGSNPLDINSCALKISSSSSILTASNDFENNQILNGNTIASELNPTFRFVIDGVEFKDTIKEAMDKRRFKMANILAGHCHDEAGFQVASTGFLGPTFSLASKNLSLNSSSLKEFINEFYYYFPTYPSVSTDAFKNSLINTYTNQSTTDFLMPLIQMIGEEAFICPIIDLTTIYSKYFKLNKAFLYSFDYYSSSSRLPASLGITHGSEKAFVFGTPLSVSSDSNSTSNSAYTKVEKQFSKQIITYWTNFIKYDDPNIYDSTSNTKYINWPMFNAVSKTNSNSIFELFFNILMSNSNKNLAKSTNNYLSLKANQTMASNDMSFRKCDFWRKYNNYPSNF